MAMSDGQEASLPPLPQQPIPAKEMEGPTPWSNWVVNDRVLAGAFPGSVSVLAQLLGLGNLSCFLPGRGS
jgi:hypothetical protein